MSIEEISRSTRVPMSSVERIEADQFDELPGEVFVRGFLKSYARSVGVSDAKRCSHATPPAAASRGSRRCPSRARPSPRGAGVSASRSRSCCCLILFTLALSIVLKPRGDDMPQELSGRTPAPHALGAFNS